MFEIVRKLPTRSSEASRPLSQSHVVLRLAPFQPSSFSRGITSDDRGKTHTQNSAHDSTQIALPIPFSTRAACRWLTQIPAATRKPILGTMDSTGSWTRCFTVSRESWGLPGKQANRGKAFQAVPRLVRAHREGNLVSGKSHATGVRCRSRCLPPFSQAFPRLRQCNRT
jgi:hypothetical protein